jgi:mono/diheme cytochrome c family protein/rhodanese-related sulfurtransferase
MIAGLALAANAEEVPKLSAEQASAAAADYAQYCALCHGADREGHANDNAPSLRSKSLMEAGFYQRVMATSYGRPGTPMAGFHEEIGGPLTSQQISRLDVWLQEQAGVERIRLPIATVHGDVALGAELYASQCAECHGAKGEGGKGTALGNPAMLSMSTDPFIRHAIVNGRQGTEMRAFGEELSDDEINALTAFIRSRATGWEIQKPVFKSPPPVDEYVLNPDGEAPEWTLKDDLYVLSADLHEAMQQKRRLVILDTRNMSLWQMSHIEGSVPLPYYYEDVDSLTKDLPRDGTWIVTYCECPRAAAEYVNRKLVAAGFENTAVLWEGGFGWVGLGYPVARGEVAGVIASQ